MPETTHITANSLDYVQIADELEYIIFQNPTDAPMRVIYSATKPDVNTDTYFIVPSHKTWGRQDTAETPVQQGKIWVRTTSQVDHKIPLIK